MSDTETPKSPATEESFADLLSQYEKTHARKKTDENKQLEGTVVSITADTVILDIGYKSEGILPLADFQAKNEEVKRGDKLKVSVKGRNPEGYYELSRTKVAVPTDWTALEKAFAEKSTIMGTVTGVVKGGVSVDVGVRAFMPASRSMARDAAEMEKLVGQEIKCRIIKLDVADEDLVVDRRVVAEEEARSNQERRYSEIKEGETVTGTVRSLMDYGAFVDIGGIDALLHVSDISWGRIGKPADVLTEGQQIEARVLRITQEGDKRRISVGMKQLQQHPWETGTDKYKPGERVKGVVTRTTDFGAFVELEPGIEGLIHISEMSWGKKVHRATDVVKPGETVEAVILGVKAEEQRISLGLKQALGNPWNDVTQKFGVGSVIEGPVTNITKFGAFVQLTEGVEGMIHVSDITAERRINHPSDVLKVGQTVKAQILEMDTEKRRVKLGIKQMKPTSLDEYVAEHKIGDTVTGRLVEVDGQTAKVELGEGIFVSCKIAAAAAKQEQGPAAGKLDLSSLSSMLKDKWKSGAVRTDSKSDAIAAGQIRSFKITKLDPAAKKIELELAAS
jgi:small subunit ribosomal protein S1